MDLTQINYAIKSWNLPSATVLSASLYFPRKSAKDSSSVDSFAIQKPAKSLGISKPERWRRYHSKNNTPIITSTSYSVLEKHTSRWLYGVNDLQIREVASLTKIMTCILCLNIIAKNDADFSTMVIISTRAASAIGTSAGLKAGDSVRVRDLLYGLMLPSGNDAAIALAEHFGNILEVNTDKPIKRFIFEMNKTARDIGMPCTHFANPHGLMHKKNLACARDIGKLACYALKEPNFRDIVNCKSYFLEIKGKSGVVRFVRWKNTNKLLGKGFDGVKTGITLTAGPCLCVSVSRELSLVIVLLNSKTMEDRWIDAKKLSDWAASKFY